MKLYDEEILDKEKVLFVYSKKSELIELLSKRLKKDELEIFAVRDLPPQSHSIMEEYKCIFFFEKLPKDPPPGILITHHSKEIKGEKGIRAILTPAQVGHEDVESIVAFAFSSGNKQVLDLTGKLKRKMPSTSWSVLLLSHFHKHKEFSRRRLIGYFLLFFLLFELAFLAPLGISALLLLKVAKEGKEGNFSQASKTLSYTQPILKTTQMLYGLARPSLSFFSLALLPDSLMETVNNSATIAGHALTVNNRLSDLFDMILTPSKTPNEIAQAQATVAYIKRDLQTIHTSSQALSHNLDSLPFKLPLTLQEELNTSILTLDQVEKLGRNLDIMLGAQHPQKYALFFYNNMELRPGGGFLGSFATVTFDKYTMGELKVYDVYDADGQLKIHLEPPTAIRDYLEQPHWFLRDSNFSPDFPENVKNAQIFLEKEMGFTQFDGAVGVTTSGITNLISVFGSIYVPDYQETVDKNNFYLKTQEYTQANFFPGSTQKKNFLSALMQSLIVRTKEVNKAALGKKILQNLDEKHIVLYFANPKLQEPITQAGWSGAILQSECVKNTSCISNSLLAVDANLGVNKANFFVSREFGITTTIQKDGTIQNSFASHIYNDSPDNSFGGDYKNFFRLYIPRSATVTGVKLNNNLVTTFQEKSTAYFKIVEMLITTKRQGHDVVELHYTLNQKLKQGKNIYQLALQKQIGSLNTNIHMTVTLPENITLISKNFPALEKNGSIAYNTTLSGNKIFILELNKQ